MITGYDSVLLAKTPVGPGIRTMLDRLHTRWPDMLVALAEKGTPVGPFEPWRRTRAAVPADAGELYVARDAAMEQRWDDLGYALMEGGEGPFAVLYQPSPQRTVAIRLNEQPYEQNGFRFDPYDAVLITAGLSLVTVVTPDEGSPFSRSLLDSLSQELVQDAR
jgi:hypothetical protein